MKQMSVRPSVCSIDRQQQRRRMGLLLSALPDRQLLALGTGYR